MSWIDSHCHLDFPEFDHCRPDMIAQLQKEGCEAIVIPGVKQSSWDKLITLKKEYKDFIYIAIGLHPVFRGCHHSGHLDKLNQLLSVNSVVAVGEIGLDFFNHEKCTQPDDNDKEQQQRLFINQLEIAKSHKLPIIAHSLKSHDQLSKIIRQHSFELGGIIHGFSGSLQQAHRFLDLGFVLGLGGAVTHQRAKKLAQIVADLPEWGYVLETDSPDMSPSFALGEINTPLNVPIIAEFIANIRNQPLEQIFQQSTLTLKKTLKWSA